MDGTAGQGSSLSGKGPAIGNVNGKKVSQIDLQRKLESLQDLYPNANDDQLNNLAWEEIVSDAVFNPRFSDLGLNVSSSELAELVKGQNPHPYASQFFASAMPNGQYDFNRVNEIVDNLDDYPGLSDQLTALENTVRQDQREKKYFSLLRNGINAPTWMAQGEYIKEYKTVDFDFVMLPYSLVRDDEVEIAESELKEYGLANIGKYKAGNARNIDYVSFSKSPSKADTTEQLASLTTLREQFASATNDSLFAISNSNYRFPNINPEVNPNVKYQTKDMMNLPDDVEDRLLSADVNTIVGPFQHNGRAFLIKTLEKSRVADSSRVRHILLETNQQDPASFVAAKTLADSLVVELKNDKRKFDSYVTQYSGDPGSKENGGVYDYFPQGQMVPTFNAAAFYTGDIGDIQLVQTQYGFHIIEVLGRKSYKEGVRVAPIVRSFTTGSNTTEQLYATAKQFERDSQTAESFAKNAEAHGGVKQANGIAPEAEIIPELGQARPMVKWANEAKEGDVGYFNLNNNLVVARLTSKTNEGDLDLVNQRASIRAEVLREKKYAQLSKQITETGKVADLPGLAKDLGRQVQTGTEAKFGASGQNIGFEPEVISKLFFLSEGSSIGPIKGRRGVYVAKVNSFGTLPPESDMDQYKNKLVAPMTAKANKGALNNALKEAGVIKDERFKLR